MALTQQPTTTARDQALGDDSGSSWASALASTSTQTSGSQPTTNQSTDGTQAAIDWRKMVEAQNIAAEEKLAEDSQTYAPTVETTPSGGIIKTSSVDGSKSYMSGNTLKTVNKDGTVIIENVDEKGNITRTATTTAEAAAKEKLLKAIDKQEALTAGGVSILGGILGAVTMGIPGASIGASLGKLATSSKEEKEAAVTAAYSELLKKYGGDSAKALADLDGMFKEPQQETVGTPTENRRSTVNTVEYTKPAAQTTTQKTPEEVKAEQTMAEQEAIAAAERARVASLMQPYSAQPQPMTTLDPSKTENAYLADTMRQLNNLQVMAARGDAEAAKQLQQLQGLTQLTDQNRDAWKQYFNPADYKAQATLGQASEATAAKAGFTPAGAAQLAQGTYQADLSGMRGVDPNAQQSAMRQEAVDLQKLLGDRARGLKPSVAEESYLSNLDKMIASQQAAAGTARGQDRSLAMRGLADRAAQAGQEAVRETAILRMQEQQAAEKAAAEQANLIMIEDQKLASQNKINELQKQTQLLSAELQNQKNLLERDIFNAEAMNKITALNAELKARAEQLNAELQTRVNLQNASERTQVSLQNAKMQTEVSGDNAQRAAQMAQWAGGQAQSALLSQVGLERQDWRSAADVQAGATKAATDIYGRTADRLGTIGASKEAWKMDMMNFTQREREFLEQVKARAAYADAAEKAAWLQTAATMAPAVLEFVKNL